MVRDFTKEAYDELLAQVDSINNVPFQEELINRVSGTPVLSNLFAGQFGGAFNEIKEYQELFFNRLHLNKSNIDRIFQDVNTVNYDYKHLYDEYKNDVLTHIRLINNLSDSFGQPNDTAFYLSVVALKSTFEKIKDQYIDDLYKEYISGRLSLTDEQMYLIKDKLADAYLSGILTPSENDMKYIHMYYDEEVARLQSDYDGIRSIYINEIATEEKLVNLFRAFNPDIAADLDTFFSSATEGSVQPYDIMNITFIAMTAEEPYKSLFFEVIGEISLGKVEHQYLDASGKPIDVISQYAPSTNRIDLDDNGLNNAFLDCRKGPYVTFFHEIGHAIDFHVNYSDSCNTGYYYSELYWGGALYDTVQRDVTNDIKAEVIMIAEQNYSILSLDTNALDMISQSLINGDKNMINASTPYIQNLYERIFDDVMIAYKDKNSSYLYATHSSFMFNGAVSATDALINPQSVSSLAHISSGLSDIFAGVTDENIYGLGHHPPKNGKSYWYDYGNPNGMLQRETYAHYFSFAITGDEEALELMNDYLPETMPMLDNMSEAMLEIYTDD